VLGARCLVLRTWCLVRGAMHDEVLQRHQPHDDEQRAAEHFAAPLDVRRDRPPQEHDQPGAGAEEKRVAAGEADGDAERPGARRGPAALLWSRRPIGVTAVHRQRRDRHQVIATKTVQEAQEQGGQEKQQDPAIITEDFGAGCYRGDQLTITVSGFVAADSTGMTARKRPFGATS